MKRLATLLLVQLFAIGVFAQSEPFVKSLKKFPQGSTILDAAMMFKKDHPEFVSMTKAPVLVANVMDPDDTSKTIKIHAAYFRNEKEQVLVQLYFADDKLYQKHVSWFYHNDSVAAVEEKYMKTTNSYISNPVLLNMEGGNVKHSEESYDLGKRTHFPFKKQGPEVAEGETGYELVYTPETGGRGFWVHMMGLNTFECDLSTKMDFPKVKSPKCTYVELAGFLLANHKEN